MGWVDMPEILARSDKWIFAASTLSEGDAYFDGKHDEESDTAFAERTARLYESLDVVFHSVSPTARSFHVARLCHGDTIARVNEADLSKLYGNTDGLVTDVPCALLRVTGADCPPVFIGDREGRIALVHSGRRGTLLDIAGQAARRLLEMGSRAESLEAVIGPGICGKCYVVSSEIVAQFTEEYPEGVDGTHLDLPAIIRFQLIRVGVRNEAIRNVGECTLERSDKWFSHRRDVRDGLKSDPPRVQSFVAMMT